MGFKKRPQINTLPESKIVLSALLHMAIVYLLGTFLFSNMHPSRKAFKSNLGNAEDVFLDKINVHESNIIRGDINFNLFKSRIKTFSIIYLLFHLASTLTYTYNVSRHHFHTGNFSDYDQIILECLTSKQYK